MLLGRERTIVLDADGILVNFMDAYIAHIHSLGHTHVWADKVRSFLFLSEDFGFTPWDSYEIFKSFTKSGGFRNLEPYPGVRELFAFLNAHQFKIIIATNVPTAGQQDRIDHFRELGLQYDHIEFGPDKWYQARKHRAAVIVDDHPNTLLTCLKETGDTVVARAKWVYNEHVEHPNLLCLGPPAEAMTTLKRYLEGSFGL